LSMLKFINAFPGLRLRFYNNYMEFRRNYKSSTRDTLENWDFNGLEKVLKELEKNWRFRIFSPFNVHSLASMKSFYHDRARAAALLTFAACLAYKKMHGQ